MIYKYILNIKDFFKFKYTLKKANLICNILILINIIGIILNNK